MIRALTKRPEPVADAAALVAAIIALIEVSVALANAMGWTDLDDMQQRLIIRFGKTLVQLIVLAVAIIWARRRVTPTEDPRDDNGNPLTPKGQ